jgi:uncharacterized protein (DUF58 family)
VPARRFLAAFGLLAFVAALSVLVPGLGWVVLGADAVLVAAFLFDLRAARRVSLSAARRWPSLLAQGVPAEISIEVTGAGRVLTVALREGLHPALATAPLRQRVEVRPGRTSVWSYRVEPRRRGAHQLLPLSARIEGPWRLAWSERDLLPPEEVRVYPRVRWEGKAGRLLALAHRRQLGLSPATLQGLGSEPYGVRRYSEGDPPNRIHWKATARHGCVMAREETWEKSARLVILLDCGRAMASMDGRRSKLDAALAAALALTRFASARGDRVLVAAFSDRLERLVRVRPGSLGVAQAYARLYDLEARLTESAYDVAAEAARDTEFRRARVVLLTSLVDLAGAELLRQSLAALRRQHRPLLVHLEDPDISRLALGEPATAVEAYAKVSALEILLANRQLATRLRHFGVETVSTSAERLTLETLEIYLRSLRGYGAGEPAGSGARHRARSSAATARLAGPLLSRGAGQERARPTGWTELR